MTVKELIETLKEFDENLEVSINIWNPGCSKLYYPVNCVGANKNLFKKDDHITTVCLS